MGYVRNAWYVAGWSHELTTEAPLAISILGERIVVWRSGQGIPHALEDRCVHRMAPLSLGRCEGEQLRCMYHGLLFNPDGRVAEIPGQDVVPAHARVRAYAVVERHSWIWVWMGKIEEANTDLIPPAIGLDHPDYILGHGQLDYAAEARLINDNLLDFSHLSYVHARSFGSGPEFSDTVAKIHPLDRGVRYIRWIENSYGSSARRTEVPMDSYLAYDFLIPGVLLMISGVFEPGTAKSLAYGVPEMGKAVGNVSFTSQAVTPMAAKTARYFFSWGPHRRHGGEARRDMLMSLADQAFAEDRVMIEAQQEVIDMSPDAKIMPTAHDRGITIYNRLVEKFVRSEREGTGTIGAAA